LKSGGAGMTSNGTKQIKRKRSDPMFDNEEYLK